MTARSRGLLKTFSLYKAAADARWFLEIEHLDHKFSNFAWPEHRRQPSTAAPPAPATADAN